MPHFTAFTGRTRLFTFMFRSAPRYFYTLLRCSPCSLLCFTKYTCLNTLHQSRERGEGQLGHFEVFASARRHLGILVYPKPANVDSLALSFEHVRSWYSHSADSQMCSWSLIRPSYRRRTHTLTTRISTWHSAIPPASTFPFMFRIPTVRAERRWAHHTEHMILSYVHDPHTKPEHYNQSLAISYYPDACTAPPHLLFYRAELLRHAICGPAVQRQAY